MAFYWILQSYSLRCALFVVIVRAEVFNTTPPTVKINFSCLNRPMGFYADIEANCRVYHTCDNYGNKFTYRCPEETAFRQDALICDHAHLVDCQAAAYLLNQFPNENVDKENVHVTPSIKSPIVSIDSLNDPRLSFSRSFQVIQRPDKSMPNKLQSGFVFSASLFLKDQSRTGNQAGEVTDICTKCNTESKNRMTISTTRAHTERFNSWNPPNDKLNLSRQSLSLSKAHTFARDKSTVYLSHSYESVSNSSPTRVTVPESNQYPPPSRQESPSLNYNNNYHSYSETLRSIQASASTTNMKPTTEIPVHALTLSLKPLVPNELEYDPYYPKQPTSTEAYYTPTFRNKIHTNARPFSTSQTPPVIAHHKLPFEIPSVLPDLNILEDLIDRRKFFYIPRVNIKAI